MLFRSLASDELIEILGAGVLNEDEANEIIMAARAHWFEDEETPEGEGETEADGNGEPAAEAATTGEGDGTA